MNSKAIIEQPKIKRKLSFPRKILLFYFAVILIGTILLALPISLRDGQNISFIDAFFTSTSAFATTGLTVNNIGQTFNLFGQIVLLMLLQIGGMGVISLKIIFLLFLGKKIGVTDRLDASSERGSGLLTQSISVIKGAMKVIFAVEFIAAILIFIKLAISHNNMYDNYFRMIFDSIFTSVSATNNGGLDTFGGSTSISFIAKDYFIQIVIMLCLIIGGIGFPVLYDLALKLKKKLGKEDYKLSYYTKMCLKIYFIVGIVGLLLITIIELLTKDGMLYNSSYSLVEKIFYILFHSTVTRSAGFYTIDINQFSQASKTVMGVLMWIGGSPASTAGGIRTTTFWCALLGFVSVARNQKAVTYKQRSISKDTVFRAFAIVFSSLFLLFGGAILIVISDKSQSITIAQALFEASSAYGTTGLSLGITSNMSVIGKISIVILMIIGQLGVSNSLLIWSDGKTRKDISFPEENVTIG